MKVPTIKQCLGSALMLTALVVSPAILKTSNANAFSPASAKGPNLTSERIAQAERREGRQDRRAAMAEELNLTSEQMAELDAIRADTLAQAEAVLTEEQQATLEGKTGRERMEAIRSLDLSEEQQAELMEIRESSRAAANEVFTDEQRAQLEEMRENRGNRRQR